MKAGFFALLLLVSAPACTTTKAIAPDPDEPRNVAVTPTPTTTAPSPTPLPVLPGPSFPEEANIGKACKDGEPFCGSKGRVAVAMGMRTDPREKPPNAPCVLAPLDGPTPFEASRGCTKDERVYITSTCIECRTYSEQLMVGLVAEMTDAQLKDAQLRASLPAEPLLRTTASWKSAFGASAAAAAKRKR